MRSTVTLGDDTNFMTEFKKDPFPGMFFESAGEKLQIVRMTYLNDDPEADFRIDAIRIDDPVDLGDALDAGFF